MKSYKNLHPQVCSLGNVVAAARSAMQGKMSATATARFHARWETHAVRLHEELTADTWRPGPYTYFDIHEPKLRRVATAPFRDRVVHHALVRVLEPLFEKKFIEDSFACRKGKGTHAGVRRCAEYARRFPVVLKCDLRRYFPSIDHEILLQRSNRKMTGVGWYGSLRPVADQPMPSGEIRSRHQRFALVRTGIWAAGVVVN